jgi:hypothetical protein
MIAALHFDRPTRIADGRTIREPSFARRSTLPLSAACLVANGVRERLSQLLAADLDVELIPPAIPEARERRVLVDGASIVRVRGRLCDAFVIIRPADASRLAAVAFGESERSDRAALSHIERATLERIAANLVPLCNTLCGTLGPSMRETIDRAVCDIVTYFEVRTTGAVRIAVGFALSADPPEDVTDRLTIDDLGAIELVGRVVVATGAIGVPAFSRIAVGATLALETALGASGAFCFGDVTYARVTCGVAGGRHAATLDRLPGDAA